jgi:hypothetical protein
MKKLLFLGVCLVALASQPVMAQTGGVEVVTVKIADNQYRLSILVTRGEGKNEYTEVTNGQAIKNRMAKEEAVQTVLAKLYQAGYSLKGTYGAGEKYDSVNTLIFVKGQ